MRSIVWFKKDLRILDNPALSHACETSQDGVIAVYIIDIEMWKKHFTSHIQIEFILNGLKILKTNLAKLNIPLIIKQINSTADIPEFLLQLADKHQVKKLFFNQEYEVNESKRDLAVANLFSKNNLEVLQFNDQLILPFDDVKTNQDNYFKVFTPFKRQWLKVFHEKKIELLKTPKAQSPINIASSKIPENLSNIKSASDLSLWPSGEKIAYERLEHFIADKIFTYHTQRDLPFLDSTSRLSPYLALGMISAKTCFLYALTANSYELDTGNQGVLTWMSELIWREFYRHILIAVPRVCMNQPYKPETKNLQWEKDQSLLKKWQQGQTGFPLVDAAMRQLNLTGWMHNRLRMVTAMFLSKNLFLDWRLGEKYFASHLIDFDFASNNGGWQWSASTGTDAVPYFRIFNPLSQSERFDQTGNFIREYCPELKDFDDRSIHDPYKYQPLIASQSGYPRFIIDYKSSRLRAIAAFKNLK